VIESRFTLVIRWNEPCLFSSREELQSSRSSPLCESLTKRPIS
jgi:hypothetical protein